MLARIFQPAKTAMQSGRGRPGVWALEFEAEAARRTDPLMGWISGSDMQANQVTLEFDSKEAAVAYAQAKGIPFQIAAPTRARPVPKAYADNFAFRRRKPWTH